jgi:two-component system, cell cycle sensor histidine kinase and response regulator CckA
VSANQKTGSLRVVLVEDSEDDARLIVRALRRGGYADVIAERVDTPEALESRLANAEWDVVISDHNLPQFSAPEALSIVRERVPDLPFIIVSGSIGEDLAVAAMKAGASDYLVKGQLARLVPAVERELTDVERRRKHAEAEEALRRTEAQLLQAQKVEAIGQLAGGIAHDFNNLLTAILGYSEQLLEDMPGDREARASLEEIMKAGERAASLTRQLLAFSRRQVLEPRVVNLNEIVTDVARLLRRLIGEDIDLATEFEPSLGRVRVDPGQMEQVLMNLAVNARDAMPHGGHLTIRTTRRVFTDPHEVQGIVMDPGEYVLVTIGDTGTGMPPEIVARIFEPFFTTKEAGKGTGLGLSTVYGIIKQSGGFIFVDSELGRGTTFDIYLPCVNRPLDALKVETGVATVDGSETILLVDDEAAILVLIRKALEGHGYRVLTAGDGIDALAVAEAHIGSIQLLITDLVMPRMGGGQLAAQLVAARRDLSVLYLSGYTDRREWNLEASLAGRAYLQKPFTPSVLMRKVRELLDARLSHDPVAPTPTRPR